jgi:hypothetical protein
MKVSLFLLGKYISLLFFNHQLFLCFKNNCIRINFNLISESKYSHTCLIETLEIFISAKPNIENIKVFYSKYLLRFQVTQLKHLFHPFVWIHSQY